MNQRKKMPAKAIRCEARRMSAGSTPREVVALRRRVPGRRDPLERDRRGEKAGEQDPRDPRCARSRELTPARGRPFAHSHTSWRTDADATGRAAIGLMRCGWMR